MNGHPAREKRLAAVAAAHDEWSQAHTGRARFDPVRARRKPGSDYNQHHLDVDPPPGAEEDFHRRVSAAVSSGAQEAAGMSVTWDDLLPVIEMSAKTAALEVTPAPYGKPGGPGLYGVAGQKHSDYFEQLVKAFREKRGMDKAGASRMAWGALKRWARGGGHVHPEVQAAAAKALAEEEAKAKTAHSHATSWDDVARDIRLSTVLEFFNPAQPRVAAGSATGGQFAAASGGQAAQSKSGTAAKGKAPAAAPAKPTAHQLHVAHFAHVNNVSTKKAELLVTAQDDKQKAAGLIKQRNALEKALQSASGKVSKGQAGATTSSNATTKTTAPSTANTSSSSTTSAGTSTTASTSKASTSSASASASAPKAGSTAAVKAQIATLNTQINNLLAAAKQAETQAATMK